MKERDVFAAGFVKPDNISERILEFLHRFYYTWSVIRSTDKLSGFFTHDAKVETFWGDASNFGDLLNLLNVAPQFDWTLEQLYIPSVPSSKSDAIDLIIVGKAKNKVERGSFCAKLYIQENKRLSSFQVKRYHVWMNFKKTSSQSPKVGPVTLPPLATTTSGGSTTSRRGSVNSPQSPRSKGPSYFGMWA